VGYAGTQAQGGETSCYTSIYGIPIVPGLALGKKQVCLATF